MKSAGQVKHDAIMEERARIVGAIQTQKEILAERIALPEVSEDIKTAWTIAIIELNEVLAVITKPASERINN